MRATEQARGSSDDRSKHVRTGKDAVVVLVVDDDVEQAARHAAVLATEGFSARVTSGAEAIDNHDAVVVVVALHVGQPGGVELVERLLEKRPGLPVLLLTSPTNLEPAMHGLRVGAWDFVTVPLEASSLGVRVRRAVDFARVSLELDVLRGATVAAGRFIGSSPAMKAVRELVERVASSDVPVLLLGETGTGKELVAHTIHEGSSRSAGPFVAANCAAVPPPLLEARLFGHHLGNGSRPGLFTQAAHGTLFLDEISEIPHELQAKLVRALQERTVRPVGGAVDVAFDARVICAAHKDLDLLVAQGLFRHDLHSRINVVAIELSPLRFRGNDVIELAHHILARIGKRESKTPMRLSPAVAERLLAYDWPGNVRELENSLERAAALARFDHITVDDLPERIRAHRFDRIIVSADDERDIVTLEILEERYIRQVIKLVSGNKSRAAELLGLDRRTLHRRLEKYEADRLDKLPPI
ncbi:MAG: sigma-54 dependent transcriptional regulator [Deltaproteobacteria bacterium]|nr:sigma-54 dependent transcriptional regulator [Deltaproteobacteria bacterium]